MLYNPSYRIPEGGFPDRRSDFQGKSYLFWRKVLLPMSAPDTLRDVFWCPDHEQTETSILLDVPYAGFNLIYERHPSCSSRYIGCRIRGKGVQICSLSDSSGGGFPPEE